MLADDHPEAAPLIGTPTGQVHDGDTFRLSTGQNARLYGADAFELNQTGRARDGSVVPLGILARDAFAPYAQPGAVLTYTGKSTYGRPVVSVDNGGDAAEGVLRGGLAIATPSFLKADPQRLNDYMEAERFARLNGKGAWQTAFQQPTSFRHKTPDPWAPAQPASYGNATAVFNDEPMPFQGLRPEIAKGYAAIFQDMSSRPEDLLAYAKANGFQIDPAETRKLYAQRAKTGGAGGDVTYKDAPRVLTDNKDGGFGAFLRGVGDPINMLDEMGAVVDTVVPNQRENIWSSDRRFGDILANNLDQNRSILAYDDANHPYARFGGQLAGGLITPGASVEGLGYRTAAAVLRDGGTRYAAEQAARSAVINRLGLAGAIEGGLAGAGQGEDTRGRIQGALIGAPAGLALGTATGAVAPVLGRLIGKPFSRLAGREGEQAAQDLTDGAIDAAKSRASNDLPRPRDVLDVAPDATDSAASARSIADLTGAERDSLSASIEKSQEPFIYDEGLGDWRNETPVDRAARHAEIDARYTASRFDRRPEAQAMENETASPTLYGPDEAPPPPDGFSVMEGDEATRLIDSVNQGPRQAGEAPSAERIAQAEGVTSRDMLPLPANTVDGVDEAARIEAGRYSLTRAPNEDAELSSRSMPSGTTGAPIRKRGPADLVTWLRSEGGIRPQGGELQRYGIDNIPRQGMDFAGGEGRFGALVRGDGMGYDEAAQRAWEAGFFPDHAERPTVAEFLDTLQATHSGGNRAFRPEDLPEVDAFEAARRQRFDVERARDEGAPLSEDRGQSVTMDDLDANAPPVRAYEEWGENAPNLAGNIRLDKLDSPQAIKRALTQTDQIAGGFDAARRGRITQAETKSLAEDLGMTADDLLKRRKGQAFNAEEALAARQLLARSGSDLVNMAKRISRVENPGDELEAAFRGAWLRHAAIQEQVAGMTAEAGRLLQQFRMTADSRDTSRVLSALGETLGGTARMKDVAERIVDLEKVGTTPAGVNQFALRSLLPKWRDKAVELYINSLLSGPQTHAVNILSNTLTSLAQLPEHALAAGVGVVRKALPGQAETDRVLFSELGARAAGMLSGAREGMAEAARSFRTGDAADAITKVENQPAIGGKVGQAIRIPTRLLTAEDELFKGIASRMELNGLAIRQAAQEGLTGQAAKDRAADLVLNPPDEMLAKSFDYARYVTFQTPLDPASLAAGLSRATQRRPELKLLFPFVKTPMNLLKFAAERSPAALVMKSWQRDVRAGGARRDLALTRAMVGTGVGAAIYEMAQAGHITGGGPSDESAKRLLQADGWQPYSLKVGNKYYSYARLDPFSTTIGTVADMVDLSGSMSDENREHVAVRAVASIINNLSSKTWLSGISSALEAVNDPDRYLSGFLARTAGSIAVPAVVAQVARTTDPLLREAQAPMDRIRSRVPGLSEKLLPRRDVFGRPVEAGHGLGPDLISPIWTSERRNDPAIGALLRSGIKVGKPGKKVGDVALTGQQYNALQARSGELALPVLRGLVGNEGWAAMDKDEKQDAVDAVLKGARKQAKSELGVLKGKAVPPPPPGFTMAR
ncbi:hypothetical protein D9601_19405 [Sphingomonas sp. MA1305]|uniref:thermonuclease family protein n=1 Tax=Sphingomonas sp. MA1305 TaxID=2479204 RepID=UPI0018E04E05|nr:hypothetical protein [Sphingomonas sp. MA1305]MBI0477506.1 hypothetical protein [Sphingomonas sp. MA1305]